MAKKRNDDDGSPRRKAYATGKYAYCPASRYKHAGDVFCRIVRSKKGYVTFFCSCRTRVFLPGDWEDHEGISASEIPPGSTVI